MQDDSCAEGREQREKLPLLYQKTSFILNSLPPPSEWQEGMKVFCESEEPPVVLVDMDNTLVNWESQFERLMAEHHPQIPIVPPPERKEFQIELNYERRYHDPILHLTSLDEFWLSMDPTPGAIDAIKDMVARGIVVFIVTTPDSKHTCRSAGEKIQWIEKYLGRDWKYRVVLTHDKTLIKGDVLIDDKPAASVGLLRPSWTHALFGQPYNRERLACPRIDSWALWGETVYSILLDRERQKHPIPAALSNTNISVTMDSLPMNIHRKLSNEVRHQRRPGDSESCLEPDVSLLLAPKECCGGDSRSGSPMRSSLNMSRFAYVMRPTNTNIL